MQAITNKRVEYFDILKGIGIVFMILGHMYIGEGFDKYIHAFHMPLFFFISGYFFKAEKYKNILKFVSHEAKTLMLPYTFFVILCQPLHYIYTGEFDFRYFVLSYFTSNHNRIDVAGAYWFLLCMFSAQIIFYVIEKLIKGEPLKIVIIVLITFIGNYSGVRLPLCMDSAMSMILMMYLGKKIKENSQHKWVDRVKEINIPMIIVLLILNTVLIFLNGNVNIRRNVFSNVPLFWINALVAIICYLNIAIYLEKSEFSPFTMMKKGLRYIGENSIVYLVTNEIVIYIASVVAGVILSAIKNEWACMYFAISKCFVFSLSMLIITIIAHISSKTKLKVIFGKF